MSSPRYLDPKTGKEVVFAHPIDGIEQAALGNVVAEKGTAPAPAPVKQEPEIVAPVASEEPATVEPLLEAPEAPSEDSTERKAPRRRPSAK